MAAIAAHHALTNVVHAKGRRHYANKHATEAVIAAIEATVSRKIVFHVDSPGLHRLVPWCLLEPRIMLEHYF